MKSLSPEEWAEKLEGSNINPTTMLGTDYLNHFNEVIMLIEMIPDMPDMIEDVVAWEAKSYPDHFADSEFRDKELAIQAFHYAPAEIRTEFDKVVVILNGLIRVSQMHLKAAVDRSAPGDELSEISSRMCVKLHRMVETASGLINGLIPIIGQSEIDEVLQS